jgi:1,4-alpha-glucan branching enzyme
MADIDNGAADSDNKSQSTQGDFEDLMSSFDKTAFSLVPYSFQMHNFGPQHEKVQICGSFDGPDWKVRHDMNFDEMTNQWFITLHLKPGTEYQYKYIINENHWIVNEDEPK